MPLLLTETRLFFVLILISVQLLPSRWVMSAVVGSSGRLVSPRLFPADAGLGSENPHYRGTSLTRKRTPLGPYRGPVPGVLGEI